MTEFALILVSSILVNNFVLVQFLGPYYYGAGCLRVGALVDDLSLQ